MKASWYPGVKPIGEWFPANRGFYDSFLDWLRQGSYADNSVKLYAFGARIALGLLDKPYWLIDPRGDFEVAESYLTSHFESAGTRSTYAKGVAKLQEYLIQRCHRPAPARAINWQHYLGVLSEPLAADVRDYIAHCRRSWPPESQYRSTVTTLSRLTRSLRWMATQTTLANAADVTPALWFEYVDARLAVGIQTRTLNSELTSLLSLLRFLAEQGREVCPRTLRTGPLAERSALLRDVPVEQLQRLLAEIGAEGRSSHASRRRLGRIDKAWFLLMLHSGLRSGEVRRLTLEDVDLKRQRIRIEQSKGLKDRIVCVSESVVEALRDYLEIRGPASSSHLLIYRHMPLSVFYIGQRLCTYAERCGVRITPHQLRHSCATLLLNAGAPILTVQTVLGHKHIDTTLGYARLYDGTVAADYYRAMASVEDRMQLGEKRTLVPIGSGHLLALVDALRAGTLNETQRETVQALRLAIVALAEDSTGIAPSGKQDDRV